MRSVASRASINQRGVGYILGLVMVLTFIFMVALVVDIARVEIFLRTVQGAADAAALAGADRFRLERQQMGGTSLPTLESTPEYRREKQKGFRLAKEAVIASLQESALAARYGPLRVTAETKCAQEPGSAFPGDRSLSPDLPQWSCYQYTFGSGRQTIQVQLERGFYYKKDSAPQPEFLTLEELFWINRSTGSSDPRINLCRWLTERTGLSSRYFFPVRCGLDANLEENWRFGEGDGEPPNDGYKWPNWRYSPYSIANALRVRITLNSLPTLLAGFRNIGLSAFSNITSRETVASRGIARQQDLYGSRGETAPPVPDPW